jgi:hypothetical protein
MRSAVAMGPVTAGVRLGDRTFDIHDTGGTRWLIDRSRRQFLRLPSGEPVRIELLALRWSAFERIQISAGKGILIWLSPTCRLRID